MTRIFFLLILWSLAAFFSLNPALASQRMVIAGSSTMAPLITELAKSFEKKNPNIKIEVQTGGSSKGIADCRSRLIDLGMVSRDLDESEKDFAVTPVAKDGLAITVHRSNGVKNLTSDQIVGIYTGKITNWKQVGGRDQEIVVISKAEGRASLDLFLHFFNLKSSQIKAEVIIGDEEQGIKTVSSAPASIAFLSVSATDGADKGGLPIRTVSLDGSLATSERVRTGDYRLARFLNLISCPTSNARRADFVRFVTSKDGQELVRQLKYIPIK